VAIDLDKLIGEIDGAQIKDPIDTTYREVKPEVTLEKSAATNTAATPYNSYALTPDYMAFRNTWWGQPQPISYKLIWKAYQEEPIIRACVDITVDAIVGDGWVIEGKTELHVKKVEKLFKAADFQKFLQDTVTSLVIFGDAYSEIVRSKSGIVAYFRPVDAATVRIDYDEHGDTLKYIQRVLHRRVDFYPDEMIHFSVNNVGGRVYGNTPIQSVVYVIQTKMSAYNFNAEYFRRNGLPRSIYTTKNLAQEQVNRMAATLRQATPQTDILLNAGAGEVTHTMVAPSNQDMQFVELMNFLRQEIIAATGVPPIFLGITEGSNRSNSQTQMESWDRKKKKLRLMIQDIINLKLLTTANFGFDDVKFKFNDENSRELLKYGQVGQLMSTIEWVTPNEVRGIMNLPALESKKVVYESTSDEIDVKTEELGDKTIHDIRQEIQEQNMAMGMMPDGKPQKPGAGAALNNPNAAHPMKNQDKKENAERLNSSQANESRKFAKSDPAKDYPFGAVEPEREVTAPTMMADFRSKVKPVIDAWLRVNANVNYDYDGKDKTHVPELVHPRPMKTIEDKAVFYKGTDQLAEMRKEKKG
jgi:HK97 family phage portal protein